MSEHPGSSYWKFGDSFDYRDDDELNRNQWERWDELRQQCPVRVNSHAAEGNVWFLLGYQDVRLAFMDPDTFSSDSPEEPGGGMDEEEPWSPLEFAPPMSTSDLRSLALPFFTPKALKTRLDDIHTLCLELVYDLRTKGRVELIAEFARVLYTRAFMSSMGMDITRADTFLKWTDVLLRTEMIADPDFLMRIVARTEIFAIVGSQLLERRKTPRTDSLTAIASYMLPSGKLMTENEAAATTFMLYATGLDPMAATFSYVFHHLVCNETLRKRLAQGKVSARDITEELLRARSAVNESRFVTRDIEFAGCPMRKGDTVVLVTAAANRDSSEFDCSAAIKIGRRPNRHLAFGAGRDHCLGAQLARSVIEIAVELWHRLIPDYRIAPGYAIVDRPGTVSSLTALPLVWDFS